MVCKLMLRTAIALGAIASCSCDASAEITVHVDVQGETLPDLTDVDVHVSFAEDDGQMWWRKATIGSDNQVSVTLPAPLGSPYLLVDVRLPSIWRPWQPIEERQELAVQSVGENWLTVPEGATEVSHTVVLYPPSAARGHTVSETGDIIEARWILARRDYISQTTIPVETEDATTANTPGNLRVHGLAAGRAADVFVIPRAETFIRSNAMVFRRVHIDAAQAPAAPAEGDLGEIVLRPIDAIAQATLDVTIRPESDKFHFTSLDYPHGFTLIDAERQHVVEITPPLDGLTADASELVDTTLSDGRVVKTYRRVVDIEIPPGEYDVIPGRMRWLLGVYAGILTDQAEPGPQPATLGIPRIVVTADGPNNFVISAEQFVEAQEAMPQFQGSEPPAEPKPRVSGDADR
jgi:hypothetical protein